MKTFLRNAIKDHTKQEEALRASGLAWTIVRPGGLADGRTGHRVIDDATSSLPANKRVGRADVAEVVLTALETPEWSKRAVHVVGI
jgi:uncharacterized protein YbjT (DUF2867 family)